MKTYARVIAVASLALILLPISSGAKPPTDKPTPEQTTLSDLDCSVNQIAKFDGTKWVCAADESASSFSKVVVDTNGVVVGPVLSDTPEEALVEVEMGGQKWHVSLRKDTNLHGGGWPVRFYMTSDCSGDAYWDAVLFSLGGDSLDFFGGRSLPQRDEAGRFRLPAEGSSPLRIPTFSVGSDPGSCYVFEIPGGVELEVYLESDLVVQEDPFAGIEPPLRIVPVP